MIISLANQKGGVCKTTSTQAMGACLSEKGYRVLMIDLDPQSNLSDALGVGDTQASIYNVLKNEIGITDAILKTSSGDLIPGSILLSTADIEFSQVISRENILRSHLNGIKQEYDYIVIDTPPALGILTINAFTASDKVIIPVGADKFSVKGVNQLFNTIVQVVDNCNSNLKIDGILLTKYNPRTIIGKELQETISTIAKQINTKVFKTYIRSSVSILEAQLQSENLINYAPTATAQTDYKNFIKAGRDLPDGEWIVPVEEKSNSFGIYKGRIVAIDYGN